MVSMAMRSAIRKLEDDNCIDPILLSLACIHPYNLRTQTLVGEKMLSLLVPLYGESREDIAEVLEEIPDIFYPVLTQQENWYRGFKRVKPKRGVLDKKAHKVLFEVSTPAFFFRSCYQLIRCCKQATKKHQVIDMCMAELDIQKIDFACPILLQIVFTTGARKHKMFLHIEVSVFC